MTAFVSTQILLVSPLTSHVSENITQSIKTSLKLKKRRYPRDTRRASN